jgi:hypothetical protein
MKTIILALAIFSLQANARYSCVNLDKTTTLEFQEYAKEGWVVQFESKDVTDFYTGDLKVKRLLSVIDPGTHKADSKAIPPNYQFAVYSEISDSEYTWLLTVDVQGSPTSPTATATLKDQEGNYFDSVLSCQVLPDLK